MAKSKTAIEEKIRVHNKGKRAIDYPSDKKGERAKYLLPGRAVTMSKIMADKYLAAYPKDLIEFDSLVSGEKKNLSKENARLESANGTLLEENKKLKEDNQALKDKIEEMAKELDEATKPVKEADQKKEK